MTRLQLALPWSEGSRVPDSARLALRAASGVLGQALQTLQTARMMQALSALCDAQLAEIGIGRRDIPGYAKHLVSGAEAGNADDPSRSEVRN